MGYFLCSVIFVFALIAAGDIADRWCAQRANKQKSPATVSGCGALSCGVHRPIK